MFCVIAQNVPFEGCSQHSHFDSRPAKIHLGHMQRLGTRMKLWHINDRGTRISGSAVTPILKTDSMELGTGNMDLDSLMAQALTIGVDAVILESHRNWVDNSPIKSLQLSAEYLKQHG